MALAVVLLRVAFRYGLPVVFAGPDYAHLWANDEARTLETNAPWRSTSRLSAANFPVLVCAVAAQGC